MRYLYIFILSLIGTHSVLGQNKTYQLIADSYKHTIIYADYRATFQTIKKNIDKGDAQPEKTYYWYHQNTINQTQGGFDGKLLEGAYVSFYLNKNLKEEGFFKNGLKEGSWKTWRENGLLIESTTFKAGVKEGKFSSYDDQGKLKEKGNYSQGKLDGVLLQYGENGVVNKTKYKDGKITIKKASRWNWLHHLFNRKKDKHA